jgi:hypothetical protein
MSLALALGCTLAELGQRMTASEFAMWAEYRNLRPWGPELDEFLAGSTASVIANYAGKSRGRDSPVAVPADFMPFAAREKRATAEPEQEPDPGAFFNALPVPPRK